MQKIQIILPNKNYLHMRFLLNIQTLVVVSYLFTTILSILIIGELISTFENYRDKN